MQAARFWIEHALREAKDPSRNNLNNIL
jgi:hypothetical protein